MTVLLSLCKTWSEIPKIVFLDLLLNVALAIFVIIIALSHIQISAVYRSRIYENLDTPKSEPYFVQATYVPRTCDVPAKFL